MKYCPACLNETCPNYDEVVHDANGRAFCLYCRKYKPEKNREQEQRIRREYERK